MTFHKEAKALIELRIKTLLDSFDFENRRKTNPNECPCYIKDKPCHDIPRERLNCFLCYCPEYGRSKKEGGCNLRNPQEKGKWLKKVDGSKIWDCSDCTFPHDKAVAEKYLKKIFGI